MAIYLRGKTWDYDFVHKGQRYTGSFGPVSRTTAKEELVRKKVEVIEGKLNPAKVRKSPRLDAFAEEYLAWSAVNRRPETCRRVTRTVRTLTALFGTKRLNELTAWHFEQFKKTRKETGLAPASVNVELMVFKALLQKAKEWGKLAEHPGKEVKPFKAVSAKTRFLSEEEETAIVAICTPALRCIVQAGLLTGFRRQELISLRPEDIDRTHKTVSVAACHAKNGESRSLPIGIRLNVVLEEALTRRGQASTVFVKDSRDPWTPDAFSHAFAVACQRAGVETLHPHVLRHTFASRLVMAGVDIRTVQELMGHKNIAMTLRYSHLSPDHQRRAIATLEHLFPEKSPANFHNRLGGNTAEESGKIVGLRQVG